MMLAISWSCRDHPPEGLEQCRHVREQLHALVEGPALDELQPDIGVAVEDPLLPRRTRDEREDHHAEAVDQPRGQERTAYRETAEGPHRTVTTLLLAAHPFDWILLHENGIGPREWLLRVDEKTTLGIAAICTKPGSSGISAAKSDMSR